MNKESLPPVYFVGISGFARSGKDHFFNLFRDVAKDHFDAYRFALADTLKEEMKHMILSKYGIDYSKATPEEKEFIRPLWVNEARTKRNKTKGRYYVDACQTKIDYFLHQESMKNPPSSKPIIIFITDIRYAYYPTDEVYWLKKEKKGLLIHLKRSFHKPANEDERINDLKVAKAADYNIKWKTSDSPERSLEKVNKFLDYLIRKTNT